MQHQCLYLVDHCLEILMLMILWKTNNIPNALVDLTNIIENNNVEPIVLQEENIITELSVPLTSSSSSSSSSRAGTRQATNGQKRKNVKRLKDQFLDARTTFTKIEEQNSKVMEIFARSVEQQASATSKLADVAMIMAETDNRRNEILNKMARKRQGEKYYSVESN